MKRYIAPALVAATMVSIVFAVMLATTPNVSLPLSRINIENYINSLRTGGTLSDSVPLGQLAAEIATDPNFTPNQEGAFLEQHGYMPVVINAMYASGVNGTVDLTRTSMRSSSAGFQDLISNPQYKDIGVYIGPTLVAEDSKHVVEIVYGAQK